MALLRNLAKQCGTLLPPGIKVRIQYAATENITYYPQTKAQLGGTELGDARILAEEFQFAEGEDWKQVDILIDSGVVKYLLEGEVGGQGWQSNFNFYIVGMEPASMEFADDIVTYSGCMIFRVCDKVGHDRIIGSLQIPVLIQSIEASTGERNGERNGSAYLVYASEMGYIYQPPPPVDQDTALVDDSGAALADDSGTILLGGF